MNGDVISTKALQIKCGNQLEMIDPNSGKALFGITNNWSCWSGKVRQKTYIGMLKSLEKFQPVFLMLEPTFNCFSLVHWRPYDTSPMP